jgi:hypothetical protein
VTDDWGAKFSDSPTFRTCKTSKSHPSAGFEASLTLGLPYSRRIRWLKHRLAATSPVYQARIGIAAMYSLESKTCSTVIRSGQQAAMQTKLQKQVERGRPR